MRKRLQLIWGIIVRPRATFREVKRIQPLWTAIIIGALFGISVWWDVFLTKPELIEVMPKWLACLTIPIAAILAVLAWYIFSLIVFFVIKLLKGKGTLKQATIALGFSLVPSILCVLSKGFPLEPFLRVPLSIWAFLIFAVAIKETHNISISKSIVGILILSIMLFIIAIAMRVGEWKLALASTSPGFAKLLVIEGIIIFVPYLLAIIFLCLIDVISKKWVKGLLWGFSILCLTILFIIGAFVPSLTTFISNPSNWPADIAIDAQGNIYHASSVKTKITKLSPKGKLLLKFGEAGLKSRLVIDNDENIIAMDPEKELITKFSKSGHLLWKIPITITDNSLLGYHIAVDKLRNIYFLEGKNRRIQKFSPNGDVISKIEINNKELRGSLSSINIAQDGYIFVSYVNGHVLKLDPYGVQVDLLEQTWESSIVDMCLDKEDNMYMYCLKKQPKNLCVKKIDKKGMVIKEFGALGRGKGQFTTPFGYIDVDKYGNIYVSDSDNFRIQKFDGNGKYLLSIPEGRDFYQKIIMRIYQYYYGLRWSRKGKGS